MQIAPRVLFTAFQLYSTSVEGTRSAGAQAGLGKRGDAAGPGAAAGAAHATPRRLHACAGGGAHWRCPPPRGPGHPLRPASRQGSCPTGTTCMRDRRQGGRQAGRDLAHGCALRRPRHGAALRQRVAARAQRCLPPRPALRGAAQQAHVSDMVMGIDRLRYTRVMSSVGSSTCNSGRVAGQNGRVGRVGGGGGRAENATSAAGSAAQGAAGCRACGRTPGLSACSSGASQTVILPARMPAMAHASSLRREASRGRGWVAVLSWPSALRLAHGGASVSAARRSPQGRVGQRGLH